MAIPIEHTCYFHIALSVVFYPWVWLDRIIITKIRRGTNVRTEKPSLFLSWKTPFTLVLTPHINRAFSRYKLINSELLILTVLFESALHRAYFHWGFGAFLPDTSHIKSNSLRTWNISFEFCIISLNFSTVLMLVSSYDLKKYITTKK